MSQVVLDSSALLAFVFEEPGAALVKDLLSTGGCVINAVNYSEVVFKLGERGVSSTQLALDFAERGLLDLLDIVDFTAEMAEMAANLRESTKLLGLSLGDRACLALSKLWELTAVTADRKWLEVPDVAVKVIR